MSRISKNIGVTVPPAMADEFERVARREHSTKSELFRRMFRLYLTYQGPPARSGAAPETWIERAILEAAEEKKANPMAPEELRTLDEELTRYGATRAEAMGIDVENEEEINDLIYAERQTQRAKTSGRP